MADPVLVPVESKPWFLSKTIWSNLLLGLAMMLGAFVPSVAEFIRTYFAEAGVGWALLNIILRVITKKELS
jgi:hypothetical protein